MSSYLTLCQDSVREIGISGGGPSSVLNQTGMLLKIVNWVADADVAIQNLHHDYNFLHVNSWSTALLASTPNNHIVTPPSDVKVWDRDSMFLDYSLDTGQKLVFVPWRDFHRDILPGTKTYNDPTVYSLRPDGNIILDPPPETAQTLSGEYWRVPTRLAQNADISSIPSDLHRIIVLRTKMYFAEEQEAPELYRDASREYGEYLQMLEARTLSDEQQGREMSANDIQLVVRPQ